MPVKMKVSNCYEYNKFLQKRGNVFHFVNQAIENWYENSPKVAGGNNIYSDKVVILIHIVVHFFRIGLRQAVGFVKGCIEQMGKDLKVISYTQASRRFKKLNLKIDDCRIDKNGMENIEIAIDSTSICIYNNTHQRNKENAKVRKYNGYDQVRKLHIILSINNKKVIDMKYTNGTTLDYRPACDMLKGTVDKYNISSVRADAAYDKASMYKVCKGHNIKPIIRPIKDAKIYEKIDYQLERNSNINVIKLCENYENGIKKWTQETKYGLRSFVKCFFYRLKKTFGFSLKNKSEINREKELLIKCYLLNKFTDIGMANTNSHY